MEASSKESYNLIGGGCLRGHSAPSFYSRSSSEWLCTGGKDTAETQENAGLDK